MYDDRYSRRQMRQMRRRYRNPMGGLAVGIFIIGLAFAIYFSSFIGGNLFLPILFAGLAFCALFGAASSGDPRGLYGGLQGFTWLMGLALCFLIGFWPWILLPVGVSIILGALYSPITTGISNTGFMSMPQANQPPPQQYQQPYQPPYQEGYQPPPQAPGAYQEGGQQYQYPPQPKQEHDQPQTQHSQEQEMPPQQQ